MKKHENRNARTPAKPKLAEIRVDTGVELTEQDLKKVAGGLNFTKITW